MSISLDRWEIQTESGYLPTVASDDFPLPTIYDTAALGEQKILICEYVSTVSVLDQEIYFNPALFADSSLSFVPKLRPEIGWYFEVNSDVALDTYHGMAYFEGEGVNRSTLNFTAEAYIETGYLGFRIRLTYYMTTDLNGFITNRFTNNLTRFTEITNDICQGSVYDTDKYIRPYTYLFDPATQTGVHTEKPSSAIPDLKYRALGACDTANTIDITFQLERNGNIVDNFSTYEDTTVLACEDYEDLTGFKVFVIRVNDGDQNKDFICDNDPYEPPTTTVKPSKLLLETGDFLLLETGDMMLLEDGAGIQFTMPKEEVEVGGIYKVFAIFYDDTAPLVESCFSVDIDGLGVPEAVAPVVVSTFIDFWDTYTENNIEGAPLQVLQNNLNIDTVTYDAAVQANLGTTSTYNDYFESITLEIYDETVVGDDTIRQIYERGIIRRNTDGFYVETQSDGLTMLITENSLTNFDVNTQFSLRSEEGLNFETQINGIAAARPTGVQSWIGKELNVDYTTIMSYQNAALPYQDHLVYPQRANTEAFDTGAIIANITAETLGGDAIQKYCKDSDFCIVVESVNATAYEIVGITNQTNFNLGNKGYFSNGAGNFDSPNPLDLSVISIDALINIITKKGSMCLTASEIEEYQFSGFTFHLREP